ncbi:UPF0103/Mediator of ErbB2-driven cell motility (Memo-related) [Aphelenchoides avenae]|nr:UPF0103/Mediator of ErbB2-driven cell motility (Memo-related) [Aphelenchus avenae]
MGESSSGYHRVRQATHEGSWYSDNATLEKAGPLHNGTARVIIAPHTFYTYCCDTAAFAFKQIVPDRLKRVFVLGPSHVVLMSGCGLTSCGKYRTPLTTICSLRTHSKSRTCNEEAEHSIDMQMPFIGKVIEGRPARSFTIVPVLVRSLTTARQIQYGKIFAHYLEDPQNLFVISSDFCHWGNRFRYSPTDPSCGKPSHEQIAALDQRGMEAISALNPLIFNDYLKKTQNTVCGRNPICVMLQAAERFRQMNNHTAELRFFKKVFTVYLRFTLWYGLDDPYDKRMTPAMSAAYKVYNVDPLRMLATLGADLST